MAVTKARSGFGTILRRGSGTGTPETFATIGEVTNISGPEITRAVVDATHMESPDQAMERIPTLISAGDLSIDLNYDPTSTGFGLLYTDLKSGRLANWQIDIPTGPGPTDQHRYTFKAYVTKIGPSIPHDGKMTCQVTLSPTGLVDAPADVT